MPLSFAVKPVWAADKLVLVRLACNVCKKTWSEWPNKFEAPSSEKVSVQCPGCGQHGILTKPRPALTVPAFTLL